jgi:phage/conjugal plasmid C-4 type zinc finger TraR family protein
MLQRGEGAMRAMDAHAAVGAIAFIRAALSCQANTPWRLAMATGWAGDGAVNDQIDATIKDAIERARSQLPTGPGLERCEDCDTPIPEARRKAIPGVRLCVPCQEARDAEAAGFSGYNRRGSKDSQLR